MLLFVGGEDADIEAVRRVLPTMGETRRVGAHVNG
jgi:3-hydroxyisobutyrate dehydrogenase-like beta-hydroxyacid dehydrogenase